MTKVRKFWRCFWLWKCSGLGVIARRYHRRYLGL
jgi:hypothetical protein